jgi:hypothetical protein
VLASAREQAPRVAEPLVSGLSAGVWANLIAGVVALVILAKANTQLRAIPLLISVGALAIAVERPAAAKPAPQFRAERFLTQPSLYDRILTRLALEERPGCAGATASRSTDRVLVDNSCRRHVRLLVASRESDAVVAASVAEMPSHSRALDAVQRLVLRASLRRSVRGRSAPSRPTSAWWTATC